MQPLLIFGTSLLADGLYACVRIGRPLRVQQIDAQQQPIGRTGDWEGSGYSEGDVMWPASTAPPRSRSRWARIASREWTESAHAAPHSSAYHPGEEIVRVVARDRRTAPEEAG